MLEAGDRRRSTAWPAAGAFYLLGEADILVAADHATFFDPHVTYGMPAVFEPALMLHRMPFGEVMRMTLLGNHERISAARALEIGLVTEVVPMADLLATAHRIAAAIASQPPTAVQASLRSLWAARELTRGADARRRQHLPPPRHEQGRPRRGPAGVRVRSAHRPHHPVTLAATVREAARRFGPRAAFVDPDGSRLSYADLDLRSDEVAAGMRAAGVGPGDVVLLTLPSDSTYVIAYAAAAKVGAITAGVNPRLAAAGAGRRRGGGRRRARRSPSPTRSRRSDGPGPCRRSSPIRDRPVALVFTSGTTGQPKGALFRERQLAAVTRIDVADAWGDPAADATPMLAGTQFAHVGFMTKLPWYLRLGTTTHVLGRWRAADALACIAEHRIPSIGGVAPQIALLLREDLEAYDLDCVQTLIVGGAASPPALVREAKARFGAAYSIRYSSTESGGCGTGTAFDADDEEALFTVGRPRGGIEVGDLRRRGRPAPRRRGGRGVAALPHVDGRVLARPGGHGPHPRAATGCARATSAASTSAASCAWRAAARRCSSGAGTTSTRPRSSACWPTTRRSPRWSWSRGPTT